jgi:hypothetical protein
MGTTRSSVLGGKRRWGRSSKRHVIAPRPIRAEHANAQCQTANPIADKSPSILFRVCTEACDESDSRGGSHPQSCCPIECYALGQLSDWLTGGTRTSDITLR